MDLGEPGVHAPGEVVHAAKGRYRGPVAVVASAHRKGGMRLTTVTPRADLLLRLGRSQESRAAYDKAIELAGNTAETAYLTRRRDQLG